MNSLLMITISHLLAQVYYITNDQNLNIFILAYFISFVACKVFRQPNQVITTSSSDNLTNTQLDLSIQIDQNGQASIVYQTSSRRKRKMNVKDLTTVKELIANIAETRTQTSANAKDENRVAVAMLNDPTYVVDVYGKEGVTGQYSPYADTREMISNIIKDTAKITEAEAKQLADNYQFDKKNAQSMVNFGKEFVLTYLQTGRKLPMGCREKSNCSLIKIHKEARTNSFPIPNGVDANGEKVYTTTTGTTPAYESIKVSGACPAHLKNKNKK